MTLVVWFALMIGVSVFWLIWFLNRPLTNNLFHLENANIALGRQKRAELQYDLQQGLIDQTLFDEAENDISQTLATELGQGSKVVDAVKQPMWLGVLIAIFIALMSLSLYQVLSPKILLSAPAPAQTPLLATQIAPLSLADSVNKIQTYLLDNPNDANAWQMLGLSYFELNQLDASLQAYEKSYQLNPKNPRLLVEYASTLATKNDNTFSGRPIELVKQALELQPDAPDALYMAGLFAVSQQDFVLAQALWQRALSLLPLESPDRGVLSDVLAELATLVGGNVSSPKEIKKVSQTSTAAYFVTINVSFSKEALASRSDEDYVMVYIKAATGRPMPVAIQKIKRKDFSGQVTLTNDDSLIPTRLLSQLEQGIVVVRLSQSGNAIRQPGDRQTSSQVIHVKDNPILILEIQ